jgi:RNA 2',3'-cyclic 3'-phosphodiesterase
VTRCFVAALLDESARMALAANARKICGVERLFRLIPPTNLHLTLQFLGEVELSSLPGIQGAMSSAVAGIREFTVDFVGSGAFPNPRRPRVVWIGLGRGASEMTQLAQRLTDALRRLGFVPDKPFTPHVTVARARGRGSSASLSALPPSTPLASQQVTGIDLMRSRLTPEGAHHDSLFRANLEREPI